MSLNRQHREQSEHFESELHKELIELRREHKTQFEELTNNYGALRSDVMALKETLYGNTGEREKGMKEKLDEMYEIVTQLKGLKWILAGVMLFGGFIATMKSLLMK